MSLVSDLNTAVEKVVQEFKGNATIMVDDKLKEENEHLTSENTELKTAIGSAIDHLTTVTQATSNMAEPVNPSVTSITAPEEHIPS